MAQQYSPMMQQYNEIKKQHRDKILFFRLGDFYEMFFDDAVVASKELELTLTGRDCGMEERAPMCGVPYHSAENYIARLLAKGFKVAICEQTTDPALSKGLVDREVVRVITRGTALENSLLCEERNNFLCSVFIIDTSVAVCFCDISCGSIILTSFCGDDIEKKLCDELCRFSPAEIIACRELLSFKKVTGFIKDNIRCSVELIDSDVYLPDNVSLVIEKQFAKRQDELFKEDDQLEKKAVCALLHYLKETQKQGLSRLENIERYSIDAFMKLSERTRRHLEITETMRSAEYKGSLLSVTDRCCCAMGKRLIRLWFERPLVSSVLINRRLSAVAELVLSTLTRTEIRAGLDKISDIERVLTRIIFSSATPRELAAFLTTTEILPEIKQNVRAFSAPAIIALCENIDTLDDIKKNIEETLCDEPPASTKDGGVIRDGFSSEVDNLRSLCGGAKEKLSQLETEYKNHLGIKNLKIGYNRVFGYYVEVSNSSLSAVPSDFTRRQTLAGAERYVTPELKELENSILSAQEKLIRLENELFDKLLLFIGSQSQRITKTAAAIAELDVFCSFAQVSAVNDYVRPIVDDSTAVLVKNGRHPVVERQMNRSGFVPNDITLDCGKNRILLITGPNMAGKSTYMRQTALIVLLSHVGCFVPADSAQIGVCDGIFTRVGASDDLASGQSTFMVEMNEMSDILQNATSKSLLILDEIGRGTSTFDGLAIARAIIEYLAKNQTQAPKTMFATHYHELCILDTLFSGIKNYSITAKKRGDELIFLRKIVPKAADDSYGIEVAKLAGLPDEIISRAKEILCDLERHSAALSGAATQLDFLSAATPQIKETSSSIIKQLLQCEPNTLSPLEALQFLSSLVSAAVEEQVGQ